MNKKLLMLLIALLGFGATAKASMGMKIDGTNVTPTVLQNYGITATQTTDSHGTVTGLTLTMTNTTIDATNVGLAITGTDYPVMIQVKGVCTITSSGDAGMTFEGSTYFTGSGTLYVKGTSGIRMLGATASTGMVVDDGAEVIAEGTAGPGLFGYASTGSKIPTFYKSLTVLGTGSAFIVKGTTKAIESLRSYSLADGYEIKSPAGLTFSSGTQTGYCIDTTDWAHITDTGLPIDSTNFPDSNFLSYVSSDCDFHSDGYLSRYERLTTTTMDASNQGIADLTGIGYFTRLTSLNCSGNTGLTALDLTSNTRLQTFYYSSSTRGQLSTLDVTGCTQLKSLTANMTSIAALDVSTCTALETLNLDDGALTSLTLPTNPASLKTLKLKGNGSVSSLDLTGCTALETLDIYGLALSALDLSDCSALTTLYCGSNQFTSLDFSGNTTLTTLYCGGNYHLTSLNLAGCTALKTLNCSSSSLGSLDVTGCTALRFIDCYNNKFTKDEVMAFFSTLPTLPGVSANEGANYIRYYFNAYAGQEKNNQDIYVIKRALKKGWIVQYMHIAYDLYQWNNYYLAFDRKGDVNDDGVRDTTDVHLLADILVGKEEYVPMADMSGDSIASLVDITLLNNYVLYGKSGVDENGRKYVDLGLPSGTLWAAWNVGGSSEEDRGMYVAWGETESQTNSTYGDYTWQSYSLCEGSSTTLTKYCTNSTYGTVDNLVELELADDAAYVNWGENWRMPTEEQMQELLDNCEWTWGINGFCGYWVASRTLKTSIFLPAVGFKQNNNDPSLVNTQACYWTRMLGNPSSTARVLELDLKEVSNTYRTIGASVRPVYTPE